ncbi:MAG: aldo/keto reductase [Alphaproteobacteria bacterium]
MAMRYRTLGRSGLQVSAIGLGGNAWGAKGRRGWGAYDAGESRPFIKRAVDCGITFFDTADAYNAGESEKILGAALKEYVPRDEVVIATKVGLPMSERPNGAGVGRKHLIAAVDQSLERLGTDYVDLLYVHRLDGITPIAELMATLDTIVRAGKARYIGGSTMPAYKFAQMILTADAFPLARPIAMQNLYNLVQREEEAEMLPLCVEEGIGLTPYSPLARGFLGANRGREGTLATERARTDANARDIFRREDYDVLERLVAVAKAHAAKPAAVALAWLLQQDVVAAPVIGVTRPEQIDEATAALDLTLGKEEIAGLEAAYLPRAAAGLRKGA